MKKFLVTLGVLMLLFSLTAYAESNFDPLIKNAGSAIMEKYNTGQYGEELFYMATTGVWGGEGDIAVYMKDNSAMIVYYQRNNRYKVRSLSDKEFSDLKSFITQNSIDDLDDLTDYYATDATEYQYMHFTSDKASAVYMYYPRAGSIYREIVERFYDLTETEGFEVKYGLSDVINGVEIHIKSEDYKVTSVWKNGSDFRVCIDNDGTLEWYKFDGGNLIELTDEPEEITLKDAWADMPESKMIWYEEDGTRYGKLGGYSYVEHLNNYPWRCSWNSYFVRVLKNNDMNMSGLWLTKKDEEPILIQSGTYANPIVIPGTDFVVCAKADNGWAKPNDIVKINLNTFQEEKLNFESADDLDTIAYIDRKLLVYSGSERYLYDIESGQKERVYGDFTGLIGGTNLRERFLQKADGDNEYYAVSLKINQAILGKLNVSTFTFVPIAEYNNIYFNSLNTWIDNENDRVYVVVNNDLISLPLNIQNIRADIKVNVNGNQIDFDQFPLSEKDRTLVPMRAIFEAIGAEVTWDDETSAATAVKEKDTIKITVDDSVMLKNENHTILDVPPRMSGDRIMVPVRAIAEGFGCEVKWDEDTSTINIISAEAK